jgi:hypothetical protein
LDRLLCVGDLRRRDMADVEVTAAAFRDIVTMARREADTGAPGGMVAVYVELALRHLTAGHRGIWQVCSPCHEELGGPWSDEVTS